MFNVYDKSGKIYFNCCRVDNAWTDLCTVLYMSLCCTLLIKIHTVYSHSTVLYMSLCCTMKLSRCRNLKLSNP